MNQALVQTYWESLSRSKQAHTDLMAKSCERRFGDLILDIARRFCSQPAPKTQDELTFRYSQAMSAGMMVSHVSHCDAMSRSNPRASDDLYEHAKQVTARPLPSTSEECTALGTEMISSLTSQVSLICMRHR